MFSSVSGFLKDLFSTAWIIAYWLPVLLVTATSSTCLLGQAGIGAALTRWTDAGPAAQALWTFAVGLLTALVAVALQAMKLVVERLLTGRNWPAWARALGVQVQLAEKARVYREVNSGRSMSSFNPASTYLERYPQEGDVLLAPTALGNVMVTLEEHGWQAYGLRAGRLWPLLRAAADDQTRDALESDDARLTAWMNVAALHLGAALLLLLSLAHDPTRWAQRLLSAVALLLVSRFAVMVAQAQSLNYAASARALLATRLKALELMGLNAPATLAEERAVWSWVNRWLYTTQDAATAMRTFQHGPPQVASRYFAAGTLIYQPAAPPPVDPTTPAPPPHPSGWRAFWTSLLPRPHRQTRPSPAEAQPATTVRALPVPMRRWAPAVAAGVRLGPWLALLLLTGAALLSLVNRWREIQAEVVVKQAVPAFTVIEAQDLDHCNLRDGPWLTTEAMDKGATVPAPSLPLVRGEPDSTVLVLNDATAALPAGTQVTVHGVGIDAAGNALPDAPIPRVTILQAEPGKPLVVQVPAGTAPQLTRFGTGHSRFRLVLELTRRPLPVTPCQST